MINPIFDDPAMVTPPDGGVVASWIIDPADIRKVVAVDRVITKIVMKRRGTYHGKRYERPIVKQTY